jgi:uridylate kinase
MKNTQILQKKLKYKRIILKISGEILGSHTKIFDRKSFDYIAKQIAQVNRLGVKTGVVIGGGNIIRGREADWFDKVDADTCGMMATIINGIIIQSKLQKLKIHSKFSSGIEVGGVVKRCNKFEELDFYNSNVVIIFVGGTGNPLFTTDTAAALRATEFKADILIKATKVRGVYSADPKKHPKAKFYKRLTYRKAIAKNLSVMDMTAFNICKESNIPICVYNLMKYPLHRIIRGEDIGTLVTNRG